MATWTHSIVSLAVLLLTLAKVGYGLVCLNCDRVADPRFCRHVATCYPDEKCGMETFISHDGNLLYRLGCVKANTCGIASTPVPMGSGLNLFYSCHDCCDHENLCNIRGCNITGFPSSRGPVCYNCDDYPEGYSCHVIKVCETHEICYSRARIDFETKVIFTSGCKSKHNCADLNLDPQGMIVGKRTTPVCMDCCIGDLCNHDCKIQTPCKDDPTCPLLLATYDICKTPTVASTICPKTCNMCPGASQTSLSQGAATTHAPSTPRPIPTSNQMSTTASTTKPTTTAVTKPTSTTKHTTTTRPTTPTPTTARPTTPTPTSARPSTPTTFTPTTARPTTPKPTTARPSTPTTFTPTPTTARPTTPTPTTARPSTPTTFTPIPTTGRPTTPSPTTVRPKPTTATRPTTTTPITVKPTSTTVRPTTPVQTTVKLTTPKQSRITTAVPTVSTPTAKPVINSTNTPTTKPTTSSVPTTKRVATTGSTIQRPTTVMSIPTKKSTNSSNGISPTQPMSNNATSQTKQTFKIPTKSTQQPSFTPSIAPTGPSTPISLVSVSMSTGTTPFGTTVSSLVTSNITVSITTKIPPIPAFRCGPALEALIKNGTRVVKGPDWKWGSQVANGTTGTVIGFGVSPEWIRVRWDSNLTNMYRNGAENQCDLWPANLPILPAGPTTPLTGNHSKLLVYDKVVRGPDWQHGNQDRGSVGEVMGVNVPSPGYVAVKWPNDTVVHYYKNGFNGTYEVELYQGSSTKQPAGVTNPGAQTTPLALPTSGPELANLMYLGAKVIRGVDWKWDDQDSHGTGTVIGVPPTTQTPKGWIRIKWDNGTSNIYRMGAENAYDLIFKPGTYNPTSGK